MCFDLEFAVSSHTASSWIFAFIVVSSWFRALTVLEQRMCTGFAMVDSPLPTKDPTVQTVLKTEEEDDSDWFERPHGQPREGHEHSPIGQQRALPERRVDPHGDEHPPPRHGEAARQDHGKA